MILRVKPYLFLFLASLYSVMVISQDKPNILWIVIEDTSPHFLGAYGNEQAKTPVMDSLCRNGIMFNQAYSTGPACSPSRYTLITGTKTYQYGTGHHRSRFPIPKKISGFPKFLREAGYYTSNNSKTDYNTSEINRIIDESWDESSNKAGWWNRPAGKPFFSVFNYADCHQSRTMTNPYDHFEKRILSQLDSNQLADPNKIDLPDYYPDTPEMRKEISRIYNSLTLVDQQIGDLLKRLEDDGLKDNTIIFFYADHGQALIRGKTFPTPIAYHIPFSVIVPEKFQDLSSWPKKSTTDDLVTFLDFAPTVLALAKAEIPDYMPGNTFLGTTNYTSRKWAVVSTDHSGESEDFGRSIIKDGYFFTRIFIPYQSEMRWEKYFDFSQTFKLMRTYHQEKKLSPYQDSLFLPRKNKYLYHYKEDQWAMHNLSNDPDLSGLQETMERLLDSILIAEKDVHFMPKYTLGKVSEKTTPYESARAEGNYPLSSIYEMAKLSGNRDVHADRFIDSLDAKNPLIRYWSSVGLKSLPRLDLSLEKILIEKMSTEVYPPTQIELAGLVYKHFHHDYAKNVLVKYALDRNHFLSLQSLQNIHFQEKSRIFPFLPLVHQVKLQQKGQYEIQSLGDILLYRAGGKPLHYERYW